MLKLHSAMDLAIPSAAGEAFLAYVKQHPEGFKSSTFAGFDRHDTFHRRLQPWPTLVSAKTHQAMKEAGVAVLNLVRSVPTRLFDNDPERLMETFGLSLDSAFLMVALMEEPDVLQQTVGRGDFIYGPRGFQCIELNMSGALGGWNCGAWGRQCLASPYLSRFFKEQQMTPSIVDPMVTFFRHIGRRAQTKVVPGDDLIRIVVATSPNAPANQHERVQRFLDEQWNNALETLGSEQRGEIVLCPYPNLERRGNELWTPAGKVHAVIEQDYPITSDAFNCWMAGSLDIYNGPLSQLLGDKRMLALLSEHQESDRFSREEREVIRQHIPWTRLLRHGKTHFEGREISLVEEVLANRDRFILKPASGSGGAGVTPGRSCEVDVWQEAVEHGLKSGQWLVQETLESFPLLYQHGESGSLPHDQIWGFFFSGQESGGGYLRLQPRDAGDIINVSRGAISGVLFEV